MKIAFLLLLLILAKAGFMQDLSYTKEVITKLSSNDFKGRGYLNEGDKIAAQYITAELIKHGTSPIAKKYEQKFNLSVNTFPSSPLIALDNDTLINTIDYSIEGFSPSVIGTFPIVVLNKDNITKESDLWLFIAKDFSNSVLLIDTNEIKDDKLKKILFELKYYKAIKAKAIIELTTNLYQSTSSFEHHTPVVQLLKKTTTNIPKEITININTKFIKKYSTQNICAYTPGTSNNYIVFTAHYDHLGMIGDTTYFPGANDNASGVSMLLNLASHFQKNKPKHNIVYLFFSGEELGLLGSKHFTDHPLIELNRIKFLLNLDLVGTGDDGIKIVNGSVFKTEFDLLTQINNELELLPAVKSRGEAANSDHYPFYDNGVPSFFIYTLGGIAHYHNIFDKAETLPLTDYKDLFKLLTEFVVRYE